MEFRQKVLAGESDGGDGGEGSEVTELLAVCQALRVRTCTRVVIRVALLQTLLDKNHLTSLHAFQHFQSKHPDFFCAPPLWSRRKAKKQS